MLVGNVSALTCKPLWRNPDCCFFLSNICKVSDEQKVHMFQTRKENDVDSKEWEYLIYLKPNLIWYNR